MFRIVFSSFSEDCKAGISFRYWRASDADRPCIFPAIELLQFIVAILLLFIIQTFSVSFIFNFLTSSAYSSNVFDQARASLTVILPFWRDVWRATFVCLIASVMAFWPSRSILQYKALDTSLDDITAPASSDSSF